MPKEILAHPKGEKGKLTEWPPLRTNTTAFPSLQQLKSNVKNLLGIIKNAEDGLQHLLKKQWICPEQTVMCGQLAAILLSLITTQGPQATADRISNNAANVIKAVAFLLEEVTIIQYAEKIANHMANLPTSHNPHPDNETSNQIKETLENLSKTVQSQAENIQKANEKLQEIQDSLTHASTQITTNANLSYRDVLMSRMISHPPTQLPLTSVYKAKLQNRINIEACQILMEIQAQMENPPTDPTSPDAFSMGKTKTAINNWLANRGIEDPLLPNSTIRAITEYRKNKILIKTNNCMTAQWLKANAMGIIQPLIGRPIKVLGRLHQVIAQFMPVQFQTNEESIRKLEISANLPAGSISHVTWLKNPKHRTPGQTRANAKIHCKM